MKNSPLEEDHLAACMLKKHMPMWAMRAAPSKNNLTKKALDRGLSSFFGELSLVSV